MRTVINDNAHASADRDAHLDTFVTERAEDSREAHHVMESNEAGGKMVVGHH